MAFHGGIAVAILGLAWTAEVNAEESTDPRTARLEYRRASEAGACPSAGDLRARIAARLGYDPFEESSERTVRVEITARGGRPGYDATIEIDHPDAESPGRRNLSTSDETCTELVGALVFTVSVAIDPTSPLSARRHQPPAPSPAVRAAIDERARAVAIARSAQRRASSADRPSNEPTGSLREQPAESPDAPATRSTVDPSAGREVTFRTLAGGGVALGAAPTPTGSFRVGFDGGTSGFTVGIGSRIDLPTRTDAAGGALRTFALLGEIAPCGHPGPTLLCGVLQIGGLRLDGVDLRNSSSRTVAYTLLGPRFGAGVALAPGVALRLHGEILAALARARAVVGDDTVWRTPTLSGRIGATVAFDLLGGSP